MIDALMSHLVQHQLDLPSDTPGLTGQMNITVSLDIAVHSVVTHMQEKRHGARYDNPGVTATVSKLWIDSVSGIRFEYLLVALNTCYMLATKAHLHVCCNVVNLSPRLPYRQLYTVCLFWTECHFRVLCIV